jgi:hypothetical protein
MEGDALTNGVFQSFNQKNASFDIVQQWQKTGTSKWQTQVRASQANVDWWFYDNVRATVHTTLYSNGGMAIGAPTGGDKGAGTLNATGLYVNGSAISSEQYLADQNPVLNPSGAVIDKALAAVSDNNYTWTPWMAMSQGDNITPSQQTDVENGTPYMMRFAQAGSNRFGAIQPIAKDLCKHLRPLRSRRASVSIPCTRSVMRSLSGPGRRTPRAPMWSTTGRAGRSPRGISSSPPA